MPALNYTSPFGERVFINSQSDLFTAAVGGQYVRITENSLHMTPEEPKVPTNLKHGTASQLARIFGRKSGSWSFNAPIIPNGAQAVAPDSDLLWQSIFGGPGSVVTGTRFGNAWAYQISDRTNVPLSIWGFQHGVPATGNRLALGCVPTRVAIDFNGNILSANVNGVSLAVVDNESFNTLPDTIAKGGLGAFPSEPGSFTANGSPINAFGGSLWINGQQFSNQCDSMVLEINTGQALKGDFVDSAYPAAVIYGSRSASISLGFANNDSTQLASLKSWARNNTPVTVEFYLGSVAGSRFYFVMNGVQINPLTLADAQGYISAQATPSFSSVSPGQANDVVVGFA